MSFTTITLTGTYAGATGGAVQLELTNPLMQAALPIQPVVPREATINGSGSFSINLVATNDPATTPIDSAYQVTELVAGSPANIYYIVLPYNAPGATIDITQCIQVLPTAKPNSNYVTMDSLTAAINNVLSGLVGSGYMLRTGTVTETGVAGTYAIDWNAGDDFDLTMTDATTFTLANLTLGRSLSLTLRGQFPPTWPTIAWQPSAPTYADNGSGMSFEFWVTEAGEIRGSAVANDNGSTSVELPLALDYSGAGTDIVFSEQLTSDLVPRMNQRGDDRQFYGPGTAPTNWGTHNGSSVGAGSDFLIGVESWDTIAWGYLFSFPRTHMTDGVGNWVNLTASATFPLSGSPSLSVSQTAGSVSSLPSSGTLTVYSVGLGGVIGSPGSISYTGISVSGVNATLTGCTSTGLTTSSDTSARYARWITDSFGAPIEWLANYGGHYINDYYNFRYSGVFSSAEYDILIGFANGTLRNTGSAIYFGSDNFSGGVAINTASIGRGNDGFGNGQLLFKTGGTSGNTQITMSAAGWYPSTAMNLGNSGNGWSNLWLQSNPGKYTLTTTGATAGTFTITVTGFTIATFNWNSSASSMQTTLSDGTHGPAGTTVTGTAPGVLTISTTGADVITASFASLTGGSPTLTSALLGSGYPALFLGTDTNATIARSTDAFGSVRMVFNVSGTTLTFQSNQVTPNNNGVISLGASTAAFNALYVTSLGLATTGVTAATTDNSTKLATTAYVQAAIAAAPTEPQVYNDLLGCSFAEPSISLTSSALAAAATVYFARVPIDQSTIITNVLVDFLTIGSTLTNSFVGVWTSAGTKVGQSADQSTAWGSGGTTGVKTIALASGPFTVSPLAANDFVWVGIYVGTASAALPSFGAVTSAQTGNTGCTTARTRFGSFAIANTATLGNLTPASLTQTQSSNRWVAIT